MNKHITPCQIAEKFRVAFDLPAPEQANLVAVSGGPAVPGVIHRTIGVEGAGDRVAEGGHAKLSPAGL
jgi:hypothetical protein